MDISKEQIIRLKNNDMTSFDEIYENTCKYLKLEIDINIFKSYLNILKEEYKIITDYEKYYQSLSQAVPHLIPFHPDHIHHKLQPHIPHLPI